MTQQVLEAMYAEYMPMFEKDKASSVAVDDIAKSQTTRQRYEDMLKQTTYMAAGEDLARGKTALNSIIGGYERSDIESEIGKINSITNGFIGSREALRDSKSWSEKQYIEDQRKFLSENPGKALTPEIEAGFGWLTNVTDKDTVDTAAVQANKQRYIDTAEQAQELEDLR
jgi:hypothetical protein